VKDDPQENIECHSPLTKKQKLERDLKLKQVQDKLQSNASQITVSQNLPFNTSLYPNLFKFKIYDSYKPKNLQMARNYL